MDRFLDVQVNKIMGRKDGWADNNQKHCSRIVQGLVQGTAFLTAITEVVSAEYITLLLDHANNHPFKALFTNTIYSRPRCYRMLLCNLSLMTLPVNVN